MTALYRSLDAHRHEIRLLNLLPESADDGFDSPIHCTLHHSYVDSPSPPPYEALTYFWGDASDTRSVTLDGRPVRVAAWSWCGGAICETSISINRPVERSTR